MSDADDTNSPTTNGADGWADALTSMGETWQKTMEDWSTMWAKNMQLTLKSATEKLSSSVPEDYDKVIANMLEEVSESKLDTSKVMSAQTELLQGYQALWVHTTSRLLAPEKSGPDPESPKDPRFRRK